ncbi:24972_t:CDS:2, partial [Gigaspora margarita]
DIRDLCIYKQYWSEFKLDLYVKVMITKVLDSYYNLKVPNKDEKGELKDEKPVKLGPEIAIANLLDSYLEVLDTWISELGRSERSELEKKTLDTLEIENEEEMDHANETNTPEIREAKHEAYEPYRESAGINPEDEIGMEKEETISQQKSADMDVDDEINERYRKKNLVIFFQGTHLAKYLLKNEEYRISVNASCKNTLDTSLYLESDLLESEKKNQTRKEVRNEQGTSNNGRKNHMRSTKLPCGNGPRERRNRYEKDIEGERQNEENYNLNDLERPDSIAVQADIMKRSTEIELTEEVLDKNPRMLDKKNTRMQENYLQENRNPPILTNMP